MIAVVALADSDPIAEAVLRFYRAYRTPAVPADSVDVIRSASHIILAGAASFEEGIRRLRDAGFVRPLIRSISDGVPVLAVSGGMHLLFDVAHDGGQHTGLGIVPGKVRPMLKSSAQAGAAQPATPFAHCAWAAVRRRSPCALLAGLPEDTEFYFDHTRVAEPLDVRDHVGVCRADEPFCAVVERGRTFGVQFDPHRSGPAGERVLLNFCELA